MSQLIGIDRQTDAPTDRETNIERERDREKWRETDRNGERQKEMERNREKWRGTERKREREAERKGESMFQRTMLHASFQLLFLMFPASLPEVFIPSVVAVDRQSGKVLAVGQDALAPFMRHKCNIIYPIRPSNKVDQVQAAI